MWRFLALLYLKLLHAIFVSACLAGCVIHVPARLALSPQHPNHVPTTTATTATLQMLLAMDSSSPELAELLKLVCKTFWCALSFLPAHPSLVSPG